MMSILPLLVLRWIAGDLHMHVSPPDDPKDVVMSAQQIAKAAKDAGMEFVILTPHMRVSRSPRWKKAWEAFARAARAITDVTLIPGAELGVPGLGHFSISGVDVAALGNDPLAEAEQQGAFVVVNHPFAVPTHIPGIPVSEYNMSYTPWTRGAKGWAGFDGVEVWNLPLALANLISRPGGATGEARAFVEADRVARTEKRRVTITGGTDNHQRNVMATTWVLADDASEASISAALHHGATCVGAPDAGDLVARGDQDTAWARIGDSAHGTTIELQWSGKAELFIDGISHGEIEDGFEAHLDNTVHTFRIEKAASRCGFIYANL